MSMARRLKELGVRDRQPRGPLWKGPLVDGITFSMLSRFLVCRERFRVAVIEGLKPTHGFNHRVEYGQMWHVCEEFHAQGQAWEGALRTYCAGLVKQHPIEQEQIQKWFNVCKLQFPLYVNHWARNDDVVARTPLMQEQVFNVPYKLPSGRVVRLRGKFDSVDLIGTGKQRGIYLQENKTKGDIDPVQLQRQLTFDLQTMLYLTALKEGRVGYGEHGNMVFGDTYPIKGVRYNVVRRPLSGGKGSIVQKKGSKNVAPETTEQYYARVAQYIMDEPEHYFMRWKVEVSSADVAKFRQRCLDPLLEQLCDWYEWVKYPGDPFVSAGKMDAQSVHWQHPFGVYNVLDEGGSTDLDDYLATGNEVGLHHVDKLFTELDP